MEVSPVVLNSGLLILTVHLVALSDLTSLIGSLFGKLLLLSILNLVTLANLHDIHGLLLSLLDFFPCLHTK